MGLLYCIHDSTIVWLARGLADIRDDAEGADNDQRVRRLCAAQPQAESPER